MANLIEEEGVRFSDPDSLETKVREYAKLKASVTFMEARQKELRTFLFDSIETEGYEDDKGNLILELENDIDGIHILEKQRRTTRKIDETVADEIILEKGLEELYKVVRVVDEGALMTAMYDGKITEEELDAMFPAKVIWALNVKKK